MSDKSDALRAKSDDVDDPNTDSPFGRGGAVALSSLLDGYRTPRLCALLAPRYRNRGARDGMPHLRVAGH